MAGSGASEASGSPSRLKGSPFVCSLGGYSPEAGVAGLGHRCRPVADLELGQDHREIVADGLLGQDESACDFVIAQAERDELEYVSFAGRQVGKDLGGVSLAVAGEEV